jgi:hypothetical protein
VSATAFSQVVKGVAYTVRATFEDETPTPPPAPAGATLFRGPVEAKPLRVTLE